MVLQILDTKCVDIQKRLVHRCGIINHTTNTQSNISEVMKENTVFGVVFILCVCEERNRLAC